MTLKPGSYSPEMKSPTDFFSPYEVEINSWDALQSAVTKLAVKHARIPLVWRGVVDSSWGLHSSLFRTALQANGVKPPADARINGVDSWPTEDQLCAIEARLLDIARDEWRLDGKPALEIMALLQHHGAPTRLLDVTLNPYIAAWFATEDVPAGSGKSGRLFALATKAPPHLTRTQDSEGIDSRVRLDETWGGRTPAWHEFDRASRERNHWGTGSVRRFWKPPAFDPRIVAQNAGFILDGVPITSQSRASSFLRDPAVRNVFWNRQDLLASSSFYTKLYDPDKKVEPSVRAWAPTFTFRITAEAKAPIRSQMEERFGYLASTIYPDLEGLGKYLKAHAREIIHPS